MTSTHSSTVKHSNSHTNTSTTISSAVAQEHASTAAATLRTTVPDNTVSSSDPRTLAVLTAAINDIRHSWGLTPATTPSTYAGLQSLVSGLSTTITIYQWGVKAVNVTNGGTPEFEINGPYEQGAHANTHASSLGGNQHGNSPTSLQGSTKRTLGAITWSTTPQTLLNNLNANKVLIKRYLKTFGTWEKTLNSIHSNNNSQHSSST